MASLLKMKSLSSTPLQLINVLNGLKALSAETIHAVLNSDPSKWQSKLLTALSTPKIKELAS